MNQVSDRGAADQKEKTLGNTPNTNNLSRQNTNGNQLAVEESIMGNDIVIIGEKKN